MIYKFYDTCSLLLKVDNLWEEDSTLVLSSITLEELENGVLTENIMEALDKTTISIRVWVSQESGLPLGAKV